MNVTKKELIAALTLWDQEYRDDPEKFWSDVEHLIDNTAETYGEQAAPCLIAYVKRVRESGDAKDR